MSGEYGFDTNMWEDDDIEKCFSEIYSNLERLVPRLDWDRMKDRSEGELLLDIAMTFGAVSTEQDANVVGLLRLPKLEASSAQSRFLAGECHPMTNLDQYGALQCETSAHVAESSHVASRLAYPLVYEAVRKGDNSRTAFQPMDVYQRNDQYKESIEAIARILTSKNVINTGYGVRLEYRMGGKAFFLIAQYLGKKVYRRLCVTY